jgi:hypothetical protein
MAVLFISHSSKDDAAASALEAWLGHYRKWPAPSFDHLIGAGEERSPATSSVRLSPKRPDPANIASIATYCFITVTIGSL